MKDRSPECIALAYRISRLLEGAPSRVGLGQLGALRNAPILPCVILGTDRLYAPQRWRPFWRRVPVWIGFGPLIAPTEWESAAPDLLGERLRTWYAQIHKHFRLRPEGFPATPPRCKGHF